MKPRCRWSAIWPKICASRVTPWPEERDTSAFTPIRVHKSQHPATVAEALVRSLRDRKINHKFHYASYKQARQWSELFERYSPFVNDATCRQVYDQSYADCARHISSATHVVGLGCGSGEKDLRLLKQLRGSGQAATYTPVDVSMPLVVAAKTLVESGGFPCADGVVCDLQARVTLAELAPDAANSSAIVTFFGMIPNFEPAAILPDISQMLRHGDFLLLSANLAPGEDYDFAVLAVLPQYQNPETEAWLLTFLLDLGIDREDGAIHWVVESDRHHPALRRIAAYFRFTRNRTLRVDREEFLFTVGEEIRLFFSYRYSMTCLHDILAGHGLQVRQAWGVREEAVFLCART